MTYQVTEKTPTYKRALAATEPINSPSLGFVNPEEYSGGITGTKALIKQNNLLIQLVVELSVNVNSLSDQVAQLTEQLGKQPQQGSSSTALPDDLIDKLRDLSLGTEKKKEKRGTFYAYKDPYLIYKEEVEKLKKQQS
uniref:Uncharacterized protein n=1 Tax=Citrus yellow mosaic virus TaxID=174178 RepID=B3V793_9VIRU|nr:unknown [Citrus yellow mosaic virus]